MKRLKIKLGWEFFSNQIKIIFSNQNNLEQHSIALIFEIRDTKLFKIKRFIKINPSLLLKTKRVQFSLLGKVSLTRKRRTAIHFERHLLTELHVFQNLCKSHNMKNRTIKINISIQIYSQKCNLLYHRFPYTKSTAWVMSCNGRFLLKANVCSQRINSSLLVLRIPLFKMSSVS